MFKARPVSALALQALMASALLLVATPGMAQDNSTPSSGYEPAPRRAAARRNDAYQPAETTPGLGTLTSPPQAAAPGSPYGSYGQAASGPSRVGAVPQDDDGGPRGGANEPYSPRYGEPVWPYSQPGGAAPSGGAYGNRQDDVYRPSQPQYSPAPQGEYRREAYGQGGAQQGGYGQPYSTPQDNYGRERAENDDRGRYPDRGPRADGTYDSNDILGAGHRFFGSTSQGLANVVENAFKRQGRPNGYILGEEAGGAFIAGLRYGEGVLYTRDAGTHKVYWQGPSVGFDVGGAGSKVMVLVYNLRDPNEIYERFGGIDGSAYVVGGVGMTLLTRDHVTLAPIRTGVGLRLGANVGYLKFTTKPTWNPF